MLIYMGSADDVVLRHPWAGGEAFSFEGSILRSVLTSAPIALNDGYIFQSDWALQDIKQGQESRLLKLARLGFLRVLCRRKNFEDMPEAMREIVATHDALSQRGDFPEIKDAASRFGTALKDAGAFMSWPEGVDIGYGFYVLCAEAYRFLRQSDNQTAMGLPNVPKAIALSIFRRFLEEFHDAPFGARGAFETRIIPSVLDSYRCKDALRAVVTSEMMGLANEFYHHNFAALLSARQGGADDGQQIAVESRASLRFLDLLNHAEIAPEPLEEALRTTPKVIMPRQIAHSHIESLMDFVTEGRDAQDAKQAFLDKEERLFQGHTVDPAEFAQAVNDYNDAIWIQMNLDHVLRVTDKVSGSIEVARDFWNKYGGPARTFLGFLDIDLGVDSATDSQIDHAIDYGLVFAEGKTPRVVRHVAHLAGNPEIHLDDRLPSVETANLGELRINPGVARVYANLIVDTESEFGTKFYIDTSELRMPI